MMVIIKQDLLIFRRKQDVQEKTYLQKMDIGDLMIELLEVLPALGKN
jgi:hypothetical protein